MRRYELKDGTSAKFWEAGVTGATLTVRFGRIGAAGQSKDKAFGSAAAAAAELAKLVKEKTGKGYALADVAAGPAAAPPMPPETAASPEPQAAVAAVTPGQGRPAASHPAEGCGKLFSAAALPTRTRPGPPRDPAADWAEFHRLLLDLLPLAAAEQDAAATWLRAEQGSRFVSDWFERFCLAYPGMAARLRDIKDDDGPALRDRTAALLVEAAEQRRAADAWLRSRLAGPPAPVSPEDARMWATCLLSTCPGMGQRLQGRGFGKHRAASRACVTHFARWLAASSGAAATVELLGCLRPTPMGFYASLPMSPWDMPTMLGLRAAIVGLPEPEYEAVVTACNRHNGVDDNPKLAIFLAFVLADDRPHSRQPLRAGPVLKACVGPERYYGPSWDFIPLIADLPPSIAAPWRDRKDIGFRMSACDVSASEAAATLVAAAQAAHELAAPSLTWFLRDLTGADRTVAAKALLETCEDDALASLLPLMDNKLVRDAVDAAERAYPAWTFGKVLAAAAARDSIALAGRVMAAAERHGLDTVRAWAADAGRKEAAYLERLIARREMALAAPDTWPPVLRDPPWRRKRVREAEVVLDLAPIPTPFGHGFGADAAIARDTYRWRSSKVLADLAGLASFIRAVEADPPDYFDGPKVDVEQCPALDAPEDLVLHWLRDRFSQLLSPGWYLIGDYKWLMAGIAWQPEPLSLLLWDVAGARSAFVVGTTEVLAAMVARFGKRTVPVLVKVVEDDLPGMLPLVAAVDTPELAPVAALALSKVKRARQAAMDWLRRHPRTAALRLLPDALGAPGPARDVAERALRWLAADHPGSRAALDAAVAEYAALDPRVTAALSQRLPSDPLDRVPARVPKLPAWVQPAALSRPVLRAGGAMPDEAVAAMAEMLLFSPLFDPYPGVETVRDACTPESLDAFTFDLLQAWTDTGAHPTGEWMLGAVARLGGDRCARALTRLVRVWAARGWRPRAMAGLDALATLGSDVALTNLKAIADKNPSDVVRGHAAARIAEVGEARGLTPDELADRLTPDLGLDERGGLDLDFGPRRFRAGFDEFLAPWARDEAGARLRALPRPNKADNAELAAAAGKRWAGLRKDAEAVAKLQLSRMETMLATSRRLQPHVFWRFFATHPLLRHLTGRLVWGVFDGTDRREAPRLTFRVAEDLNLTDVDDAPVAPDLSEDAPGRICLVHPLHLPPAVLERWVALFNEYEIAQPFPQLARETYAFTAAEAACASTGRFEGAAVAGRRLRGLRPQGWPLESNGESAYSLVRGVVRPDGTEARASLWFSPGIWMGRSSGEDEVQTLGTLALEAAQGAGGMPLLGELDPVTASELLRGPSLLAGLGGT